MNDVKVVAIVQARMGSSRLPNKSLMKFEQKPILGIVLERTRRASLIDAVYLATSTLAQDDSLQSLAESMDVPVFRGPHEDVLKRFVMAAEAAHAQIIVRICADNPFIAPEEIDRVIGRHLDKKADYTFNHIPAMDNGYPDGLGAEVVNFSVLKEIDTRTLPPHYREHVTKYIWDHPDEFSIETVKAPKAIRGEGVKLDVDTKEDFERMKKLAGALKEGIEACTAEAVVKAYREIFGVSKL